MPCSYQSLIVAIYKIDAKGRKTKLSTKEGTNRAIFSKSMKYYINTFTNLTTPQIITINDNTGKTLTTLVDNQKLVQKLFHEAKEAGYPALFLNYG